MASASLLDELTCCICLNIYTDPVTLSCGHSYCLVCIGNVLDTQERSGVYSCPECRIEFQERPALEKNRKLRNIVETFLSTHQQQEAIGILCTYCIQSPVPAAKTCLTCDASLCEKHLLNHSKSAEHVLTEPTSCLENRECPIHDNTLVLPSSDGAPCVCLSHSLTTVKEHQVNTLSEAFEQQKENLRNILEKLTSEREEAEKRVQSLQEPRREVQEKAAGVTERVTGLIRDIRDQLEALEKRVLSEISRQEEQVSLRVSDLIRQLEIKKEDLSRKMGHIEEKLYNMTDPLTVLQGQESDSTGSCDAEEGDNEDRERDDKKVHGVGDLDVALITVTLHTGLADIVTGVKRRVLADMLLDENMASDTLLDVNPVSDMLLDVNMAGNYVTVSDDLKSLTWSEINQSRPVTPQRFQDYNQVLSIRSFSSGRHYWEVEGSDVDGWRVGMAYPSIGRNGSKSLIGYNKKSWCLWRWCNQYSMRHDSKGIQLSVSPSCQRFGISLDYEAGRLSFYELCDPIRLLHTFTASFTEPLHAVQFIDFRFIE
ncbi:E3 ubiquitin/ISG15 ligase TRIM25-like isoform 1-T1 [Pelodytes ibericus]